MPFQQAQEGGGGGGVGARLGVDHADVPADDHAAHLGRAQQAFGQFAHAAHARQDGDAVAGLDEVLDGLEAGKLHHDPQRHALPGEQVQEALAAGRLGHVPDELLAAQLLQEHRFGLGQGVAGIDHQGQLVPGCGFDIVHLQPLDNWVIMN